MRAIILAAGYATRLRPLTDSIAKQLLPVGGRPMLDWVCDKVEEISDDIHLVTNSRFADDFRRWAAGRGGVTVHDDGTLSNDDRLGAIGDIAFVLERDRERRRPARDRRRQPVRLRAARARRVLGDEGRRERARGLRLPRPRAGDALRRGRARRGRADRRLRGEALGAARARSSRPRRTSTTGSTCRSSGATWRRATRPDQPGRLVAWLCRREPVYGYAFDGEWYDIGSPDQLLEADNRWRARVGLPPRTEYSTIS